jgi:hypothetical protein
MLLMANNVQLDPFEAIFLRVYLLDLQMHPSICTVFLRRTRPLLQFASKFPASPICYTIEGYRQREMSGAGRHSASRAASSGLRLEMGLRAVDGVVRSLH